MACECRASKCYSDRVRCSACIGLLAEVQPEATVLELGPVETLKGMFALYSSIPHMQSTSAALDKMPHQHKPLIPILLYLPAATLRA